MPHEFISSVAISRRYAISLVSGFSGVFMPSSFISAFPYFLALLGLWALVVLFFALRKRSRSGSVSFDRYPPRIPQGFGNTSPVRPPRPSNDAPVVDFRPSSPLPRSSVVPPVPRRSVYDFCHDWPALLSACGGDVSKASRLVDYEAKRSPTAAPDALVSLALSSFRSDRR